MLVGAGASMIATTVVERSLKAGWRAATSEDPPMKPEALTTSWKEAIVWTALSAVVLGLTQTFARRGAAVGWQHFVGKEPPL